MLTGLSGQKAGLVELNYIEIIKNEVCAVSLDR